MSEEQKTDFEREEQWIESTVRSIMSTAPGRFWMSRLLEQANVQQRRYLFDGDALGMAFRDGMAEIGVIVHRQLELYDPNGYMLMMRERRARLGRIAAEEKKQREAEERQSEGVARLDELADEQAEYYRKKAEAEALKRAREQGSGQHKA